MELGEQEVGSGYSYRLSRSIYGRYSFEELQRRFSQVDLIVIDFDECLFPGFSQTTLGKLIFWKILLSPLKFSDRRFLPSLLSGGIFICLARIRQSIGNNYDNRAMMEKYEDTMRGIPLHYFREAVVKIPVQEYLYSSKTIKELSRQARVGIISFGVDVVMQEYTRQLNKGRGECVSFYECNILRFEKEGDREVFMGYQRDEVKTDKAHKGDLLKKWIQQCDARTPMVIGHNEDDTEMVAIAQGMNGIGIGFNPSPEVEDIFDLKVYGKDWESIYQLVRELRHGGQG
jgi:hypothetical protein